MARGFESKDVEFQQAERERARDGRRSETSPEQRAVDSRRAALALSLARMRGDLDTARVPAHRTMLERASATLESELASLP